MCRSRYPRIEPVTLIINFTTKHFDHHRSPPGCHCIVYNKDQNSSNIPMTSNYEYWWCHFHEGYIIRAVSRENGPSDIFKSEVSGEPAHPRSLASWRGWLAWSFTACICPKAHFFTTWLIIHLCLFEPYAHLFRACDINGQYKKLLTAGVWENLHRN